MNNNDNIEILDDFDLDDLDLNTKEEQSIENNSMVESINPTPIENNNQNEALEQSNETEQKKETDIENPVVEMINNKTTMKLIAFLLVVLFAAVILMPQVFKYLK